MSECKNLEEEEEEEGASEWICSHPLSLQYCHLAACIGWGAAFFNLIF